MAEWHVTCAIVLRTRNGVLEYFTEQPAELCPYCGHGHPAEGEAIRLGIGLAHVACVDEGGQWAARGGR